MSHKGNIFETKQENEKESGIERKEEQVRESKKKNEGENERRGRTAKIGMEDEE